MQQVLFFDGVCVLCNGFVDFLLKRPGLPSDIKFCSIQTETAATLLGPAGFDVTASNLETMVLLENEKIYTHSDSVLRTLARLGGAWGLVRLGFLFPRFFRDSVYRLVARNRYRLFGKLDVCRLPTAAEKSRFLE